MIGYQRGLASTIYIFFDKRLVEVLKNENMFDQQLTEELHKSIIRKFTKGKVYSSFIEHIWGADIADVQLLNKLNKGTRVLLCAVDVFGKYTWVIPLKDKKGITIINAFEKISDEYNRKPNKIQVDKGSEFYNIIKTMAGKTAIDIYSIHKKEKSIAAEIFIR